MDNKTCRKCRNATTQEVGGLLCKACARTIAHREKELERIPTIAKRGADEVGRPQRSPAALGGTAELEPR